MRLSAKVIIAAIIAVLLMGVFIYTRLHREEEIIHPSRGNITEAVYALGKVKSDERFEVIVGVDSTVTHLFTREGDQVAKGAPLIEFDRQATFRAPFAGTVTYVKAFERETVVPRIPVLRLENLRDRYIELSLEQQAALRVKKGLPAKISLESVRGKVLLGKVTALYPREDEFLAQVRVDDLDPSVLPGMTADVTVEVGKIENVILVPLRAIQNGMVTKRVGSRWNKVKVDVGHVDGINAEIRGDTLSPSDEIRVPVSGQGAGNGQGARPEGSQGAATSRPDSGSGGH